LKVTVGRNLALKKVARADVEKGKVLVDSLSQKFSSVKNEGVEER
jgi:hypothetical protein